MAATKSYIDKVVDLLTSKPQSQQPDFFYRLALALQRRGYTLESHQRGILGTHIVLIKNEPPDRTPSAPSTLTKEERSKLDE
jgi:hypothetical protein